LRFIAAAAANINGFLVKFFRNRRFVATHEIICRDRRKMPILGGLPAPGELNERARFAQDWGRPLPGLSPAAA
jgi:hypothetical protein